MIPFFLQGKALGPSQDCSPYNKKMKMVMKELLANPLNGEVDCSMKWCQCALVKDGVLKTI
jgi:hypothetical protein